MRLSTAGGMVDLAQRQPRARRIQHADGLVGQLPVRRYSGARSLTAASTPSSRMRTLWCFSSTGTVAAQHHDALRLARLLHLDDLEAPRQRGVLLEVLLVLGPRGGGDGAQLAARQRGLQQVGGVVLPRRAARADHGVGFVDEEDDRRGRGLHLLDQPLEPVLELALDARAGLQQGQVERAQHDVLEHVRHVALQRCAARSLPPPPSCPRPPRR